MELDVGKIVTGTYEIERINVAEKLIQVFLKNNEEESIEGVLKDNLNLFINSYQVGDTVVCRGKIRKKRKNYCLDIASISKKSIETKPIMKINLENYIQKFEDLISSVKYDDYRRVLENCFNDDVKELFFTYPASRSHHHSYVHGLLQHSIDVAEISLSIASHFSGLDKDLIVTGSLLHDIGKLKSYDVDDVSKIQQTNWHSLLGHLSMSALFVSKVVHEEADPEKMMRLYHLILSHHGDLNSGSPIECKTKEAYIVHEADMISSRLGYIDNLEVKDGWTEKHDWYVG